MSRLTTYTRLSLPAILLVPTMRFERAAYRTDKERSA